MRSIYQLSPRRPDGRGRRRQAFILEMGRSLYGITRTSFNFSPGQPQRLDRPGRAPGKNDQAGHPRYAESASAGKDTSGDRDRRSASAGEETEGKRGESGRLDA